jgi:hypothetical protein
MDGTALPPLDVYQVAYLAGGPDRVVDTALVALLRDGRVRAGAPGELVVGRNEQRHPVEAAVLDALGQGHARSVSTVRWRVGSDVRLDQIRDELVERHLVGRSGWAVLPRRGRRPTPSPSGREALAEAARTRSDADEVWRTALMGREAVEASRVLDQPAEDRRVRGPRLTARMDELARDRRYHAGPPQP